MKKSAKRKIDFCGFVLPTQKNNILEFDQYMKSDEIPYIVCADIESLIKKIDNCKDNPNKSSTTKTGKHIPCRYSMSKFWAFDHIENKHRLFCGKDYMKKLY